MRLKQLFSLFICFLLSSTSIGKLVGICQNDPSTKVSVAAQQICKKNFEQNECEDLKTSLSEENQKKLINCENPSESVVVDALKDCGTDAVIGFFWPIFTVAAIPQLFTQDAECFYDIDRKQKMIDNYNLIAEELLKLVPDSDLQKTEKRNRVTIAKEKSDALLKLSCTEILNSIEQKNKQLILLKAELMKAGLWEPEQPQKSFLAQVAEKSARDLGLKLDCYRIEYKIGALCGLISFGTLTGLAAKSFLKSAERKAIEKNLGVKIEEKIERAVPTVSSNPQMQLWKLKESGQSKAATQLESRLEQSLKNEPLEVLGETKEGMSVPFIVKTSSGVKGIWKRAFGNNPKAEIATAKIDKKLQSNWVPMVVERELDGKPGTLHLFVEGEHIDMPAGKTPEVFSYFDYLIRQIDRHDKNFLLAEGRPVAIDHSLGFLPREVKTDTGKKFNPLGFRGLDYPKFIERALLDYKRATTTLEKQKIVLSLKNLVPDKKVFQNLRDIPDSEWRKELASELTPEQINNFLDSRNKLVKSIEKARQEVGNDIFRDGPNSPLIEQAKPKK